jgi:hypothetical protein
VTGNGWNDYNPATANLPVEDIEESFNKNTQILPYAGLCDNNGTIANQGTQGSYWSTTPANSTYGYHFFFHGSAVNSVYPTVYPYGHTIRCVRI